MSQGSRGRLCQVRAPGVQAVLYCCLAASSDGEGLPWARRHNVDLLGSDCQVAVLRLVVLPRVVVGRFAGSTIGMACRSGRILLNTRCAAEKRRPWQIKRALTLWGEME
jgi:hypothetical protein